VGFVVLTVVIMCVRCVSARLLTVEWNCEIFVVDVGYNLSI